MYAYVTCHPDIGYTITTISKFLIKPPQANCEVLKGTTWYLRVKSTGGVKYRRFDDQDDFKSAMLASDVVFDENFSMFSVDINKQKNWWFLAIQLMQMTYTNVTLPLVLSPPIVVVQLYTIFKLSSLLLLVLLKQRF